MLEPCGIDFLTSVGIGFGFLRKCQFSVGIGFGFGFGIAKSSRFFLVFFGFLVFFNEKFYVALMDL
jgi:hypothetical protein